MPTTGLPRRVRYTVAAVGSGFTLAGAIGIDRVFRGKKDGYLLQISTTNMVIGVILIGGSILSKNRTADDQTYRFGYDVGYERGGDDERDRPRPRPVIVDFKKLRPFRRPGNGDN